MRDPFYYFLMVFAALVFLGCSGSGKDPRKSKKAKDPAFFDLVEGYYSNPQNTDEKQQNEIIEFGLDNNLPLQRTALGTYYYVKEPGVGPPLRNGESISVHYRGYFLDGREFDSSYRRNQPLKFQIGQMISGWNDALLHFQSKSKGTIIVPSRLGYGEQGHPSGVVPPNTIIAFDVEVLY